MIINNNVFIFYYYLLIHKYFIIACRVLLIKKKILTGLNGSSRRDRPETLWSPKQNYLYAKYFYIHISLFKMCKSRLDSTVIKNIVLSIYSYNTITMYLFYNKYFTPAFRLRTII